MNKINIIGIVLVVGAILGGCYILYDIYQKRNVNESAAQVTEDISEDIKEY